MIRLRPVLLAAVLAAACAKGDYVVYQDPDKLFSAEVPGSWKVLDPDGARRASFIGVAANGAPGSMLTVMFYPASTAQGRDADAFAVAHRLGARPLGPVEAASVAGTPALRYAVVVAGRTGETREETAIVRTAKGLFVILYDDKPDAGPEGAKAFERLLSSARF